MSDSLSVLDIAWLIYAHRLSLGGYPIGITGTERRCCRRNKRSPLDGKCSS